MGVNRPYLVTEYGPDGWWEMKRTPGKAVLEPTSTEKAVMYRSRYRTGVEGQRNCLGSFAFILGHKEEATFTLFGTHLDTGEKLAAMDAFQENWTGTPPKDPAPAVRSLTSSANGVSTAPGATHEVHAMVDGRGPLTYVWKLATDRSSRTVSGVVADNVPSEIVGQWMTGVPRLEFTVPDQPDAYRMYLFVTDTQGKADTANFPFRASPIATGPKK